MFKAKLKIKSNQNKIKYKATYVANDLDNLIREIKNKEKK